MTKITLADLPDDIRKKIEANNHIPRKERSFQIYASDLSRVFDIGEIADMFVTVIEGKQVLRIRYYDKEDTEFVTVTVPVKTHGVRASKKAVQKTKPTTKTPKPNAESKEQSLPQKMASAAKDFLFNPVRNEGKREMFGGGREFDGGFGSGRQFGGGRFG